MATPDQLRTMITARPFLPFLVKLASGQAFTVTHPENASCDPKGRSMVVQDEDGLHLLEMLLVEVMERAVAGKTVAKRAPVRDDPLRKPAGDASCRCAVQATQAIRDLRPAP